MKLSIVTINYNNATGLQKTISSVIQQTFTDFEYIIIDGGSSDNSINVIREYGDHHINYWISEEDDGVYNAMNKGIQRAKGDYLLMLNSGDYLINHEILSDIFKKEKLNDVVYGDIIWEEGIERYGSQFPGIITFKFLRTGFLGHQATFIKRSLHGIIGLYDENYKIVSDWKFFLLAICKYGCSYEHIALPISVCPRDGLSCDPKNLGLIKLEKQTVLKEDFSAYLLDYDELDNTRDKLNCIEQEINAIKHSFFYKAQSKLKYLLKFMRKKVLFIY